ncbi:MAG: hypothetical protein GY871_04100 [Actinomycetales bacterium]|nr:hypothetical protein [Actinomycetales bacterium]
MKRVLLHGFRHYAFDGRPPFPSVTSILSMLGHDTLAEAQEASAKLEADEYMQRRAREGTATHDRIERVLRGEDRLQPMEADRNAIAGIRWARANIRSDWYPEERVWHPGGWAGTLDLAGVVLKSSQFAVCDWKTRGFPKKPSDELLHKHRLQGGAYALGREALHGQRVDQIRIVYLGNGRVVHDEHIDLATEGQALAEEWLDAVRHAHRLLEGAPSA